MYAEYTQLQLTFLALHSCVDVFSCDPPFRIKRFHRFCLDKGVQCTGCTDVQAVQMYRCTGCTAVQMYRLYRCTDEQVVQMYRCTGCTDVQVDICESVMSLFKGTLT